MEPLPPRGPWFHFHYKYHGIASTKGVSEPTWWNKNVAYPLLDHGGCGATTNRGVMCEATFCPSTPGSMK